MKKIKRGDLFRHIDLFLSDRGIELNQNTALTQGLREGCHVLADTINKTQTAIGRARKKVGGKIDTVRSIIHEKTAPQQKQETPIEQTMKTKKKTAKKAPAKKAPAKKAPAKKAPAKKAPAKKAPAKKAPAKKAPAKKAPAKKAPAKKAPAKKAPAKKAPAKKAP
ncbi:MAG: histone H1-like repetitive region-containing protein, partial [Verrucomicrobiota bacterium]|nr:histone H1-like repetitive region-containing protein [Verrucomicrobiota bacterium]